MHIAEGLLPMSHAMVWTAVAVPAILWSAARCRSVLQGTNPLQRSMLGMATALLFALTLFPVPVPMVGVCSHICGTPLIALILGWRLTIFPIALVLLIQALFFGHGGITTWGANVLTLGLVAPLVALTLSKVLAWGRCPFLLRIGIACAVADLSVYAADAALLGLAYQGTNSFEFWFVRIAVAFAPAQIPIALLEGILSAFALQSLLRRGFPMRVDIPRLSVPVLTGIGIMVMVMSSLFAPMAVAYEGMDVLVLEKTGEMMGMVPRAVGLSSYWEGNLLLAVYGAGFFAAGLIVGTYWQRAQRWV